MKEDRKERVPLGAPRLKLSVTGRQGYHRRWINDNGDRLNQALEGGYSFVARDDAKFNQKDVNNKNESLNNAVCKTVNSDGGKAYLMEIPINLFNKDRKEKQDYIDKTEDGLKRGEDAHGTPGRDGRYIPREGIKFS